MLHSLEIRNYRNLKHLTIEKLGRVNLLVGKNNTGKTSVLEAVALCVSKNVWKTVQAILSDRGYNIDIQHIKNEDLFVEAFSSLFSNNSFSYFDQNTGIIISENYKNWYNSKSVLLRLVKVFDSVKIAGSEDETKNKYVKKFFCIHQPPDTRMEIQDLTFRSMEKRQLPLIRFDTFHFVGTNDRDINPILWDEASFYMDKKSNVIAALKLFGNSIKELSFIETDNKLRKAHVLLENNKTEPLSSMGDGINRILTIILAMVNCEKGYLLIDEFENGLHYSVQEKLWEIIFYLAERLDIQVFATTHSSDAIRSFATVLAQQANAPEAGKVIRLQNHDSTIVAVEYTPEELEAAVEFGVEVR